MYRVQYKSVSRRGFIEGGWGDGDSTFLSYSYKSFRHTSGSMKLYKVDNKYENVMGSMKSSEPF